MKLNLKLRVADADKASEGEGGTGGDSGGESGDYGSKGGDDGREPVDVPLIIPLEFDLHTDEKGGKKVKTSKRSPDG